MVCGSLPIKLLSVADWLYAKGCHSLLGLVLPISTIHTNILLTVMPQCVSLSVAVLAGPQHPTPSMTHHRDPQLIVGSSFACHFLPREVACLVPAFLQNVCCHSHYFATAKETDAAVLHQHSFNTPRSFSSSFSFLSAENQYSLWKGALLSGSIPILHIQFKRKPNKIKCRFHGWNL